MSDMRLPWRTNREVSPELAEARRIRAETERKLQAEREHVVIPLRNLREKNHVSEAITMLIQGERPHGRPS